MTDPKPAEIVPAIKGFKPDLTCRGFQFKEGETFEADRPADVCHSGFHAVELPLDVFRYYPLATSVFHSVELEDVSRKPGGDSKVAGRKIKVGASLNLVGLIKAHVEAIWTRASKEPATTGDSAHAATTGRYAHAATTGHSAHAATTGRYANAATTGDSAHAATTGDSAHAATTGRYAHAATTGNSARAATTGHSAHAATTGNYAHAATTGDSAHAATTGHSAHAATTGRYANAATTGYSANVRVSVADPTAVAAALGRGAAKGGVGCWLVLTERDDEWNVIEVRAVQVDGTTLKADTYYRLAGGKVVEA